LLQNQKSYWKQRREIKWVKLGDANIRFFHTKGTINFRHNHIEMLKNSDDAEISDHDGKADILWKAFKERMGNTDNTSMQFNLREILNTRLDEDYMKALEEPFSQKEIEDVVKDLPN
jgi:hypothetical protein